MIDIHCHILPGLDDGPLDIAESISMAKQAVADGIHTLVATPHTLNDKYLNPHSRINKAIEQFQSVLSEEQLGLKICPGSDVHVCSGLTEKVMEGEVYTINNRMHHLLVEFPVHAIPEGSRDELFKLRLNGITPIITHPERNLIFQYNMDVLHDLINMGCLIQVTAMSITGDFGREAMESVHKMLQLRLAHIIASDAHSSDRRPPILSHAVEVAATILQNESEAMAMVSDRPQAVIDGEDVVVPEALKPKKRWWEVWA
ncbi:MAG TPA: protein-tyrosine phosphatase [Deltaproteobacteria bacterium]|nr:protein-tyrosine phosphatase [Deltaproteobacteria bacterium]